MCSLSELQLMVFLVGIFKLSYAEECKSLMEQNEIVPDLLSVAPELCLKINYENGVVVENGLELTPTQAKLEPLVTWDAEDGAFYSLIMTSPDAPSRVDPALREVITWLVMNIPGTDLANGDVCYEYFGAGPPEGTGLHRYVFLVYKQPGKLSEIEEFVPKTSKNRFKFSTEKFAEKYQLGTPVAGNFFFAQYDDFAGELHKQSGMNFDIKNLKWQLK